MSKAFNQYTLTLNSEKSVQHLQDMLLKFAVFNFFIVACIGLLLRSFPFLSSFPLQFKNILHAHSHFAFGGWIIPMLIYGILKSYPELTPKVSYKHWKNIIFLILVSAYGMLFSFPFEGYATISIIFSTLSIIGGIYFGVVILKNTSGQKNISILFLRASIIYLILSSVGPFATGPLIAMGKSGSVLYFDAIYFYLHFQYNGFFTLALLAIIYKNIEDQDVIFNNKKAFYFFNLSVIPAYMLSTLWSYPPNYFYIIGAISGIMQIIALYFFIKDLSRYKMNNLFSRNLFKLSMAAFILKNILQLISSFQPISTLAYTGRNFIIAYLHLVLLGFISLALFAFLLNSITHIRLLIRWSLYSFLVALTGTEILLVFQALEPFTKYIIPHFTIVLWGFSLLFPVSILLLFSQLKYTSASKNSKILSIERADC